jgi:hypothetical protein
MKHVVRNALIPVVTLVALTMPQVFGGAIVTEQIFRVPGHRLAAHRRDPAQRHARLDGRDLRVLLPRHLFNLIADLLYAGSTLASATASAAVATKPARHVSPWARRGGASAATSWRWRASSC